ncbi:MAG: hypothetical protein HY907_23090 [Deltaproteobacteria bacterium]|nr:hypothetical protein [Deltaproteobacteria bacterium]
MRTYRIVGLVALGSLGAAATAAGCFDNSSDCEVFNTCGGTTSTTGTAGSGGSVDPGCVPSDLPANTPLPDTCAGVFVSGTNGNDGTGDGTRGNPYASVATALAGGAAVVYACAAPTADTATVQVPAGSNLFGGLDCADWHYTGDKTVLAPDAQIAMILPQGAAASGVADFEIHAAAGTAAITSSIGVIADGATAAFERTDVFAGNGAVGEKGATPTDDIGPTDPNDAAIKGGNGNPADTTTPGIPTSPGEGRINALCDTAAGGNGGTGGTVVGAVVNDAGPGGPGLPALGGGTAGLGETSAGNWNCVAGQGLGGAGVNGGAGNAGPGASGLGTLTSAGYSPAPPGGQGGRGLPGQGGGGGGGARGRDATPDVRGPSGGGGGSGGCGGFGGLGGTAGGASIAFVSLGATVTFTEVTLHSATGGGGGEGGDGQGGRTGGNGGDGGIGSGTTPATLNACAGGSGGQGGFGGKGGGGRGGHSLGLAFTGTAPDAAGVTFDVGTPGQGGLGAGPSGNGADGATGPTQQF